MTENFRLFWLRESGCDSGTPVRAEQLEPEIRTRVLALAAGEAAEIILRLPFFDRQEWRRRGEVLRTLRLAREGDTISVLLAPNAAARNLAATLVLTDPAWTGTPDERDPFYFPLWQKVSLALQRALRMRISAEYFSDLVRYQDKQAAYPLVVYQVTRACYGRPRTEFTYDLSDYPDCDATLTAAWKLIGQALQNEMARIERTLHDAGMPELARRYAPVWYEDVLVAVQKKPKSFVGLLAAESELINSLIDLGTERSVAAVNRFAKTSNQVLRRVYGMDLRGLGVTVLEEATRALE